ncbi:MAG TPA: hypothetical protein VMW16_09395 [Sedimentisphaerales bacterium]|nr:hypothetical protein [Sedimentisphaerales bacterium]
MKYILLAIAGLVILLFLRRQKYAKQAKQPDKTEEKTFDKQVNRNLKGIALEKKGYIDKAAELYEQNVSENFEGNHPYDRLAIIYRKRNQIDDEIRVLEKAVFVFEHIVHKKRPDRLPKLNKFKERLQKAQKAAVLRRKR